MNGLSTIMPEGFTTRNGDKISPENPNLNAQVLHHLDPDTLKYLHEYMPKGGKRKSNKKRRRPNKKRKSSKK